MRIVLGSCLDGGAWPGPLRLPRHDGTVRAAVLDEVWVGVESFVDLLAVRTGCARLDPPGAGERAADLARRLCADAAAPGAPDAPWAASLAADPLATARALLRTKDALRAAGVDDDTPAERLPPRLAAVHAATRGALPGLLERVRDVERALRDGWRARVDVVEVVDEPALLPVPVQRLLAALVDDGARVTPFVPRGIDSLEDVPDNDAARVRRLLAGVYAPGDAMLRGDGSLVLLRHDSVDETAACVAAFLAETDSAVVVAPDGDGGLVLDEALARHHVPPLGVRGDTGSDALLALLPLVVAVGDEPVDPARLFELCALPLSPVPRPVGARIAGALLRSPAVHSPAMRRAVDEGLAALHTRVVADAGEDVARARVQALRARVLALVPALARTPSATSTSTTPTTMAPGATATASLRERLLLLLSFLQGRKRREFDPLDDKTPYRAALRQVTTALRLLDLLDAPSLSPPQLLRLLHAATDGVRPPSPHAAGAGLVVVDDPGAVLGPAATVVWWGFSQASGQLRPPRALSRAEQQALRAAGFTPPSPDDVARHHARAQRRPFDAAVERLVLCCSRRGASGAEHHPHPLWDELLARLPARSRVAAGRAIVRPEDGQPPLVPEVIVTPRPCPQPRRMHRAPPGTLVLPPVVSPSRDEWMLGCPLRFVLAERGLGVRGHRLKDGPQLEGDVVHAVVARVLRAFPDGRPVKPDDAAAQARACFVDVVAETAGAWLLSRRQQQALRVRERAARAVHALVSLLVDNGFVVRAVEAAVKKPLPPLALNDGSEPLVQALEGTPDLVVEGPLGVFVVDHKTGGDADKRMLLGAGGALQLVEYAAMVGERGRPWPSFGYYQLRTRRLVTTDARVRGAEIVDGPVAKDAWRPLERARAQALAALRAGQVIAAGVEDGLDDRVDAVVATPHVAGGVLRLAPPCWSCRADVLCGRAFRG